MTQIIIGTRGSPLALWQATWVQGLIREEYPDITVELQVIRTTGDNRLETSLAEIGGKGLFLKEIEEKLATREVDIGVHSMKDVPAELPEAFTIGAILKREDPRDVLVSAQYASLVDLPKKARIGTGSVRRLSQIKNLRPDIEIVPLRGNVETRLQKMKSEKLHGVILAAAGLHRLGFQEKISDYISPKFLLPSAGQGAVGIEIRKSDKKLSSLLQFLNHEATASAVMAERAFVKALDGDCRLPIAALGEIDAKNLSSLKLRAFIATPDGSQCQRGELTGSAENPEDLGLRLAQKFLDESAKDILDYWVHR